MGAVSTHPAPTSARLHSLASAPAAARGSRGRGRWRLSPYLYVLPAAALVGGIVYYSLGYTVWLSTLEWDGISPVREFVGLGNFRALIDDPVFWETLRHSLVFALTIPTQMVIGLALAVALHSRLWFTTLYKIVVFVPVVLAPAVMAPTFRDVLDPNGQLNLLLDTVGLGFLTRSWVADPDLALYAVMGINVWQWTGFSFILYYAALTQIDRSVLEAARVDGASNWRTVRHLIVPMMKGTHVALMILGVIGVLKTFDIVFLVTDGGPVHSSEMLATYIYDATILNFRAGYGAALTVVLLVLSLVFTVLQVRRYRFTGEGVRE
jgi:raffinose/stachyose/melibiose transport system permease protein